MNKTYPNAGPEGFTTSQVISDLQRDNPGCRFAVSPTGETIAVWTTEEYGWLEIYTIFTIGNKWIRINGLPLLNGKKAITEWIEV
jgi:hypothetical protein